MANRHPVHHRSSGAAWALLLGLVLLVAVTAFTAGRAFSSSSCSACAEAANSPRLPYKLHLGPSGSSNNTSSTRNASLRSGVSAAVEYAGNLTEHPVCAFFRQGERACLIRPMHMCMGLATQHAPHDSLSVSCCAVLQVLTMCITSMGGAPMTSVT